MDSARTGARPAPLTRLHPLTPGGQGSPATGQGPHILIVDDNEQNLELVEAYLDELGGTVATALDGAEALKAVEARRPDLVLLDVMMPRMSGYQVCKKLKGDPATKGIRIIMLTALNEVSDMERAADVGADGFLSKPVTKPELLAKVRAILAG